MFSPFDSKQFWKDYHDAHQRKIEKLKTFQPGDRVTKPWFTPGNLNAPKYINGIFIEATDEITCKVKWENQAGVDDDVPVSLINHAE